MTDQVTCWVLLANSYCNGEEYIELYFLEEDAEERKLEYEPFEFEVQIFEKEIL